MKKYDRRPALLVASSEDAYSVRSVKELAALGAGTRDVRTLSQAGHGTAMLTRQPDLVGALVDWFQRTLL
jgi:hypothetical protein